MKKTIRTIIAVIVGATLTISLSTSCKKAEQGPQGEKGATGAQGPQGEPGPQAKTYDFNLTFTSSDTFKSYSGVTGYDADDAIIVYVRYETLAGTPYWAPLPLVLANTVNIVPEFSDLTGLIIINTLKANGSTGSPWTTTTTLAFRAVLIKSSKRMINVNYDNYKEVQKAYNLKD